MKYVVFQHTSTGSKLPVVFPDLLVHANITAGEGWKPISAGNVYLHRQLSSEEAVGLVRALAGMPEGAKPVQDALTTIAVSGESTSLKLGQGPHDALLLLMLLNNLESAMVLAGCAVPTIENSPVVVSDCYVKGEKVLTKAMWQAWINGDYNRTHTTL